MALWKIKLKELSTKIRRLNKLYKKNEVENILIFYINTYISIIKLNYIKYNFYKKNYIIKIGYRVPSSRNQTRPL